MEMVQKAEIALVDSTSNSKKTVNTAQTTGSSTVVTGKTSKAKVVGKPKMSSPKLKKDEALEVSRSLHYAVIDIEHQFGQTSV